MNIRIVFLWLVAVVLISCPREEAPADQPENEYMLELLPENDARREKINTFMQEGPGFVIGKSLSEIKEHYGEPIRQNIINRQNIHNPEQTDQIYELSYEGLFLRVYHVSAIDKDIIILVEVTSDEYPVTWDLTVGATKEKVVEVFGEPDETNLDTIRYLAGEFVMGFVDFTFKDDLCSRVAWHYLID